MASLVKLSSDFNNRRIYNGPVTATPSMKDQSDWLQAIGETILLIGSDDFYASLCNVFIQTLGINHPLLLYFPEKGRAQALHYDYKVKNEYFRQVESYVNGPYVLDPFYQAGLKGLPAGAYRLKEVAPDNFKKTEYFRRYYRTINFRDEICFIQSLPKGGHMQLSMGPADKNGRFPKQTVRFLKSVSAVTNSLILRHWNLTSSEQSNGSSSELRQTLQQALQHFGSSILTEREQAVLQLVLHGHSNKSAAEKLGITLATVKLHRKHIYKKLDISSQSELFYLFIDSLSSSPTPGNDDPLTAYMNL